VTLYSTTFCTLLSGSRTTRNTRTLSFPYRAVASTPGSAVIIAVSYLHYDRGNVLGVSEDVEDVCLGLCVIFSVRGGITAVTIDGEGANPCENITANTEPV